jgi:hypothetical protein
VGRDPVHLLDDGGLDGLAVNGFEFLDAADDGHGDARSGAVRTGRTVAGADRPVNRTTPGQVQAATDQSDAISPRSITKVASTSGRSSSGLLSVMRIATSGKARCRRLSASA